LTVTRNRVPMMCDNISSYFLFAVCVTFDTRNVPCQRKERKKEQKVETLRERQTERVESKQESKSKSELEGTELWSRSTKRIHFPIIFNFTCYSLIFQITPFYPSTIFGQLLVTFTKAHVCELVWFKFPTALKLALSLALGCTPTCPAVNPFLLRNEISFQILRFYRNSNFIPQILYGIWRRIPPRSFCYSPGLSLTGFVIKSHFFHCLLYCKCYF